MTQNYPSGIIFCSRFSPLSCHRKAPSIVPKHTEPFKIQSYFFPAGHSFKNKKILSIPMSSFKALTHKFKYKSSVMLFLISSDNRIFHPPLLTWPGILSLVAKNIGYIHLFVTIQWEDKSYPSTHCFLPSVERACLENRRCSKISNKKQYINYHYTIRYN